MAYVYVFTNQSLPGTVKVGFTERTPEQRAAELSRHSGVPTPFKVAWARECINPREVEVAVHRALGYCRVSSNREFFNCEVQVAVATVNRVADGYLRRRYHKPIKWGNMMRWLYLIAALCGFIAVITRPHASLWWVAEKGIWVVINLMHLLPHHHYY